MGFTVGAAVGEMLDGIAVGSWVGLTVGANVGFELVGFALGCAEGLLLGSANGWQVGYEEGSDDGEEDGRDDGLRVEYEAEAGVRHLISVDFHDTISQGSDIPTN